MKLLTMFFAMLVATSVSAATYDVVGAATVTVSLNGRELHQEDARVSACPFNRVWTGKQRTLDQTKLAKFVSFDLEKPQTLEIRGIPADAKARLFPLSEADRLVRKGDALQLRLDRPAQYVLDFGGAAPDLHVFADPPFVYRHVPGELYFGPGEHDAGVIAPTNGQTVCIDRGAVVYGALFLDSVTNVSVVGRGILDNSRFTRADERAQAFRRSRGLKPHDTEYGCHACVVYRSENVLLEGFVIRDTPLWALIARSGSRHVVFDNIKIVGQWRYNSDGIDICASSDVLVKNCFVRSFDDCLVVLGAYLDTLAYVSENVRFENCRCWCDWGATFKIWSPPHTNTVRNVTVSDCAFMHNLGNPIHVKDSFGSADTRIENIVFDGIEMDYAEPPLKMVHQESDEARYPGDRRLDEVVVGQHLCGWPCVDHGNQKFVRIENPTGQHSLISNVIYRNFTFPGLTPKLSATFRTSLPDQSIRGVRYEGFPPIEFRVSGEGIEPPVSVSAATYDVVVAGGSTMGVAAAEAAAKAGAKVLLVEPRPYLGADLAGKLRLDIKTLHRDWKHPNSMQTRLFRAVSDPTDDFKVVTPLRIKQLCDRQLLESRVPFRTWTYPCGIRQDAAGDFAGLVLYSRNGKELIEAKVLVDATEFGYLSETAGSELSRFESGRTEFRRNIVLGGPKRYETRKFDFEMSDFTAREFAAAEQAARDATWETNTLDAADSLLLVQNRRLTKDAKYVHTIGLYSAATDLARALESAAEAGKRAAEEALGRTETRPVREVLCPTASVDCDVLVAGAGTGGAPAAIAAARSGLRTIVCDPLHRMGGVMTDGLIDCYCHGLRIGFTSEIDRGTASMQAAVRGIGKAEWLRRAAREAGAEVWFGAMVVALEKRGESVASVLVAFSDGSLARVTLKCAIDATGNADLAAMAGEETEFIDGTELSLQGAGSTAKVLGRTYMNTDCGFVDDTDAEDLMNFTLRARQSMGAYAWDQSQIVNSRERRRMHGVAYVTPQDVIMNRTYPDVIARTRSNFDTHGQTIGSQFFIEAPHAKHPITVNLPYGCILPKKTDGLLVIGLGMSAHRDAMPILRMQPDVQNQGYAAGTAAAMAVKGGVVPRKIDVRALQKAMIEKGVLGDSVLTMKDSFPLSDATLAKAASTVDDGYKGLAELLTDPKRTIPLLRAEKGLPSAHVLAMLGDGSRAQQVADAVAAAKWDKGWNYRGMDQFGRSVSWIDSYLIALGRARAKCAMKPLLDKAAQLSAADAYSHFRAVALCAEGLGDKAAVPALSALLAKDGVGGHSQRPVLEADVVPMPEYAYWESGNRGIADRERSDCLRELCLARALYNLGDDAEKSGERVLRAYADDPRRAYANHARKVLKLQ